MVGMKSIEGVKRFVPQIIRVHGPIQMNAFHETNVFHTQSGNTLRHNRERDEENYTLDGSIEKSRILTLE
jgi:hypothetical protein